MVFFVSLVTIGNKMKFLLFLAVLLFHNQAFSSPVPETLLLKENKDSLQYVDDRTEEPITDAEKVENLNTNSQYIKVPSEEISEEFGSTPPPNDLVGEETFYPVGGVWWGVRPWGGWGRPGWGGWGGWGRPGWGGWGRPGWGRPGWHGPYWGGYWGGRWR